MKTARSTTVKTEIQELIVSLLEALSHSQIQKSLGGLCNRVTIYQVLERLLVEGVIHKIVKVDGVVKYASCHSCSTRNSCPLYLGCPVIINQDTYYTLFHNLSVRGCFRHRLLRFRGLVGSSIYSASIYSPSGIHVSVFNYIVHQNNVSIFKLHRSPE